MPVARLVIVSFKRYIVCRGKPIVLSLTHRAKTEVEGCLEGGLYTVVGNKVQVKGRYGPALRIQAVIELMLLLLF
jgi:hypothetical protein